MTDYYRRVGEYFDADAEEFDERYWANTVIQRIRQVFREEVKRHPFQSALDVGCGSGLDLVHFGTIYPDRTVHGIDVSERRIEIACDRIEASGCTNVKAVVASVEDAPKILGTGAFDLVYVFFGALNTVEDLNLAADRLYTATAPGGYLVLTFVNRYYLADIAIGLIRGRWKHAFRRFRPVWGGYSTERFLPSRCATPQEVRRAFGRGGREINRRGFSITYPAWYRHRWLPKLRRAGEWLWELDRWLNHTPAWCAGEYILFVFRKDTDADVTAEAP